MIDRRVDVVINRFGVVEEGVAPIDPYLTSVFKSGGVSEDEGEGSMNGLIRYCGNPTIS